MIIIPQTNSTPNCISDAVEYYVTLEGAISKPTLKSHIASLPFKKFENERIVDATVDSVWQEMLTREGLYGENPPFKVGDMEISRSINWEDRPEYLLCVILSIFGNRYETVDTGKLFEILSNEAIKLFIGGDAVIYGHPRNLSLRKIAKIMNEDFVKRPQSNQGDQKLDLIAWKPFKDIRPNKLVILIQCAGGHNWKEKLNKLPYQLWCRYVHWGCNPLKGFTTPVIIPQPIFNNSPDAGLLIDRPRIYNCISQNALDTRLKNKIIRWCQRRFDDLEGN